MKTVTDSLSSEKPPFILIYHYQLLRIWQYEPANLRPYMLTVYCYLTKLTDARDRLRGAWPSYQTIATDTGISRRQVINAVHALVACDLIKVIPQHDEQGDRTSNLYVITFDPPVVQEVHHPVSEVHYGGAEDARGVVQEVHPNKNQIKEDTIKKRDDGDLLKMDVADEDAERQIPTATFKRLQQLSDEYREKYGKRTKGGR